MCRKREREGTHLVDQASEDAHDVRRVHIIFPALRKGESHGRQEDRRWTAGGFRSGIDRRVGLGPYSVPSGSLVSVGKNQGLQWGLTYCGTSSARLKPLPSLLARAITHVSDTTRPTLQNNGNTALCRPSGSPVSAGRIAHVG